MISLGVSGGPGRREVRNSGYTDAIVSGIVAAATGGTSANPAALGALEVAAGLWSRSFALATVDPAGRRTSALTASWRAQAARELCRHGSAVYAIDVARDGRVTLLPAADWFVQGSSPDDSTWRYRLSLYGPDGSMSRWVPSAGVVHLRYASDPATPWLGRSPLGHAADTGALAASLEKTLHHEAAGPVGALVPVPRQDGDPDDDDDSLAGLRADIAALRGRAALVETTSAAWGEGRGAAPQSDWKPMRIGANPPASLATLRDGITQTTLAACGVPPSLVSGAANASGAREALRIFFRATVLPLARLIEGELQRKLDSPVRFDFRDLAAADVATAARATKTLTEAGVSVDEAKALAGL